jgi:AI-2 transport protein TqsA
MVTNPKADNSLKFLIVLTCLVVIVTGCREAASLLVEILLSVFIATICAPFLFWLQRRRIPTVAALMIIMLIVFLMAVPLVVLAGGAITEFSRRLPNYQLQLRNTFANYLHWFDFFGIDFSIDNVYQYFNLGLAMRLASNILTILRSIFTSTFFILLTVTFILLETAGFPQKLAAAFGDSESTRNRFDLIFANINRYMVIKTLTSLATGAIVMLLLYVIGVDFYFLWGLLAFMLNFVPTIGSFIAAIPAVLLTFIQFSLFEVMVVCFGYLAVNTVIGSFIEPRLFGKEIGLSALVVFLSLVFWGWVLGPVVMLLSVPLTMIVKIALEGSEDTRWLAVLLGTGPVMK